MQYNEAKMVINNSNDKNTYNTLNKTNVLLQPDLKKKQLEEYGKKKKYLSWVLEHLHSAAPPVFK